MPHLTSKALAMDRNSAKELGMGRAAVTEVAPLYNAAAERFDARRTRFGGEEAYLARMLEGRSAECVSVLDLGCGTGRPIADFFMTKGCAVTGVDAAPAMIAICRERFPLATWVEDDMRSLALGRRFDAIVAWDSFFHLTRDDQRAMFPVFGEQAASGAMLLFTSGPAAGEATGDLFGEPLYHASLDAEEYRALLQANGFGVVVHRVEDPACGGHTVWLARKEA